MSVRRPARASRQHHVRLSVLVCGLTLGAAASSRADDAAPPASVAQKPFAGAWAPRRVRYDAHAALTWDTEFGAGGRADISIFDRSRLYDSHDELSVSVGGDVAFLDISNGKSAFTVLPTAVLQWSLGASERLSLYPELGLVGRFDRSGWDGIYPNIGFGARYYVLDYVSVFARLGWPVAFAAGATF